MTTANRLHDDMLRRRRLRQLVALASIAATINDRPRRTTLAGAHGAAGVR